MNPHARRLRRIAQISAALACAMSAWSLVGPVSWMGGTGTGQGALASRALPVTALLLAAALVFLSQGPPSSDRVWIRRFAVALGALAAVPCVWALLTAGAGEVPLVPPGRAALFLLVSAAVVRLANGRAIGVAQAEATVALVVSHVTLSASVFAMGLDGPGPERVQQATTPGILLALVSLGVVLARTDRGWASVLSDPGPGGRSVRRWIVPAIIGPPVLVAGVVRAAEQMPTTGFVLLSTVLAVALALLIVGVKRPVSAVELDLIASRAALRDVEQWSAAIVAAALDCVVTIDARGRLLAFNPSAEKTFGWHREDVLGRDLAEILVPERYRAAHRAGLQRYLGTGESRMLDRRIEMQALRSDGTEIPVELAISAIRTEGGTVFTAHLRDIRDRVDAEERIRRSLEEKDVLLREVHHRVKNNLQMISSLLSLQSRREKDRRVERAFREAVTRIRSIALLHERLYAARDVARFDLGSYLEGVCSTAATSLGADPDAIEVVVGELPPGPVSDAAVPCGLIATELVTNALKHGVGTGGPGRVRVSVGLTPDADLHLVVEDGGPGLPEGWEASPTLGTQIVALLARQLRGSLSWGRSDTLGGARVDLVFPRASGSEEGDRNGARTTAEPSVAEQ